MLSLITLSGGSDRVVSALNGIYSIETLHPWLFHGAKEWLHGLHDVEETVRAIKKHRPRQWPALLKASIA